MIPPALEFACRGGGRVEIATSGVDGDEARLDLVLESRNARVEACDGLDTDLLDDLWKRLGEEAADECRLSGRSGRVDLTLRWAGGAAGLRLALRPANGLRVELEVEVEDRRAEWRQVLTAWLRERAATDLDLPGL